jgi:hypothetical protein
MHDAVLVAHIIDRDIGGFALLVNDLDVGRAIHPRHQHAALRGAQLGFAAGFIDHPQQCHRVVFS